MWQQPQQHHPTPGPSPPGPPPTPPSSAGTPPGPIMRPPGPSQVPVVAEFHPPLRPNFGAVGRPIVLRANHFQVCVCVCVCVREREMLNLFVFLQVKIPSCVLYHYDVAIIPDKCPRRVNREIIEALISAHADYFGHQKPVFDGRKNLYSRRPLPIGRDRVSSSFHNTHTHTVSQQPTGDLWVYSVFNEVPTSHFTLPQSLFFLNSFPFNASY